MRAGNDSGAGRRVGLPGSSRAPTSVRSCGEPLGGTKPRAPRARVRGDLVVRRRERRPGHEAETGRLPADAHGRLRRADAAATLRGEEPLDDAVLERVVGQDDDPSARTQQVHGGGEALLERVELLVDRDPQRLEDARGRVDPAADARVGGRDALDERRQLLGGLDRGRLAGGDDGLGDLPRGRLLAVLAEQRGQLVGGERREQLRGRHAARRVEAHVERPAGAEAEAPLAVGQLERRQPEVEQRAVHGAEARPGRDRGQLPEVRPAQDQAIAEAGQADPDPLDGDGVRVQAQHPAVGAGGLQDPLGVPTAADRRVDLQAAGRRGQGRR